MPIAKGISDYAKRIASFNADSIIFDNTPWRPGRDLEVNSDNISQEDERKLKQNLATRILSNGVEVLVKDKNTNTKKPDQRRNKLIRLPSIKQPSNNLISSSPKRSLLTSAVATVVNRQHVNAMFPLHQLMQHNYIIKTCLTTYTYLTTVVQNKRSAVSTFETIVSVVTTESLTNLFPSDLLPELNPTKTKFMEVKTIQPSQPSQSMFRTSIFPKINKRVDHNQDDEFDYIQPSEVNHALCTTSCPCSQSKTEYLDRYKTKFNKYNDATISVPLKVPLKTSFVENSFRPSDKETFLKTAIYRPYEYETDSNVTPIDKVVEKYTEVVSDYSDEKESVEESELLTNEQAPNKKQETQKPQKNKTEKPTKQNKNKFVVADLLKLGSLGIKGLSQLAPVIEKMTGTFMKRQDVNNKTLSTTTIKPQETTMTSYNANKRIDNDIESKHNKFPIYIPVDELDVSETQYSFKNATLHQNLAWANDHKHPKAHKIIPPKIIHESPLVNGGIPISPGEIITANSDVIVGKPAVGGPLTLTASGLKLQNTVVPPRDSYIASSEQFMVREPPPTTKLPSLPINNDDSYDLRPPELPRNKYKQQNMNFTRPIFSPQKNKIVGLPPFIQNIMQTPLKSPSDQLMETEKVRVSNIMSNHGTPVFLDYIPSLGTKTSNHNREINKYKVSHNEEFIDSSPSSSEIINNQFNYHEGFPFPKNHDPENKPFLVDIQPSRVANVLIPHGSSTALVFAGSSEPHKTGDYIDDPLPYPEPGYFGSFSIDAPQMTNVHNVAPNEQKENIAKAPKTHFKHNVHSKNPEKHKWREDRRPGAESHDLPPPTSNQQTHFQIGPHITSYNPDIYNPSNGDFEDLRKVNENKNTREVIDKDYENYLAVPPPPPKSHNHDNRRPYHQRPIVHTKPIQDMKVFLNIQHPISKPTTHIPETQLPPKVTSEIYFAAQTPEMNKQTPLYTLSLSNKNSFKLQNNPEYFDSIKQNDNSVHQHDNIKQLNNKLNQDSTQSTHKVAQSYSNVNKPIKDASYSDNNMYTVTLNTATNVANRLPEIGQVVGSSVPVAIGSPAQNFGAINANIPVGTNFAIRVDGNSYPHQEHNLQGTIHFEENDNKWNISKHNENNFRQDVNKDTILNYNSNKNTNQPEVTYLNSHANFPMVHEVTTILNNDFNIKPVTEEDQDNLNQNHSEPTSLIPHISNSHGWYSSNNPIKDLSLSSLHNINNIKIESSTRNIIPLSHDYETDKTPNFGQKIATVGKPPTEYWNQSKQTIGKPFTKQKPDTTKYSHFTTKPFDSNYIPSNSEYIKQPVYDIPIKFDHDESTTTNAKPTSLIKPVYESSYEIYDGTDEDVSDKSDSGEVSQESMSVPFVSISPVNENSSKLTPITLLQEEVLEFPPRNNAGTDNTIKKIELTKFDPGTQTEKPFETENNEIKLSTKKPMTEYNKHYNMKPRPFTMETDSVLDHQLHQPHWQINQLWVNQTNLSSDENVDVNYGDKVNSTTQSPSTKKIVHNSNKLNMYYNKPPRTVFSIRPNNSYFYNDTNIITSTFYIKDKKPLTVIDDIDNSSTLPTYTVSSMYYNTSSDIIDLSPPPPTMDYNFKPTNKDETIMGMSPPPPQTPIIRPATRSPPSPRPVLPSRTPSPYRTKPPRIPSRVPIYRPSRKPISDQHREEVSTYRPTYDITKNNIRRPIINANMPSSQLLPPPKEASSKAPIEVSSITPVYFEKTNLIPNIIFPTPTSSGWVTSSGIGFSSSFDFNPTVIQFPAVTESSYYIPSESTESLNKNPESTSEESQLIDSVTKIEYNKEKSTENNENEYSTTTKKYEKSNYTTQFKKEINETIIEKLKPAENISKDVITDTDNTSTEKNTFNNNDDSVKEEKIPTDKPKPNIFKNRDRTRKPYPVRENDKKTVVNRFKPPLIPTPIIKPTRTLTQTEFVESTKLTNTRRIIPLPGKAPIIRPSIIESSEVPVEENYIKPTEVLRHQNKIQTNLPNKSDNLIESSKSPIESSASDNEPTVIPTHHAGNEVKVYDEIIPTKTEFKTTVVTLTKTLLEPPQIVSKIGYLNITHTLTVTETKTSLISQSAGAVTQTLILTNTHTSTVVDIVTKIQTEVQPTTVIETVTKHIPVPQVEPTPVLEAPTKTVIHLDDVAISSEEDNLIIRDIDTTENIQKIDKDEDNDTFFVVMNKSQNGGSSPPVTTDIETDYDGITRNEQVNNNGVSQVLFGEILLAGTPYLETTNIGSQSSGFGKECQPDCKASRNERCQRIDGMMKCVCRPGFARMFPDRPCKPTYTYSVKLALSSKGKESLKYHDTLANNTTKEYNALALATHEGINRMVMQSDLRDVYHGVHITGFHPVKMKNKTGDNYQGVVNDFYVQLSDNAHESRLKEVIEKYLRNNNYSLGGTDVFASSELINNLEVSDFDECTSVQFHDCSEHAQCFNLRGTYTCSCLEGYADLSVNNLYPGRICSAEPVGCELCNYHGACYSRDDRRVLCECFQWYAGSTCQINLKVVLISLVTVGAFLTVVLVICAIVACSKRPRSPPQRSIVACIQGMPGMHQGAVPKQRADRRALISERAESGDASSVQNASLPYMPTVKKSSSTGIMKKCVISEPPTHEPPPPPAPAVMIPRARLHPPHRESRDNLSRKQSLEVSEAKLISYLEAGASPNDEMMRRKLSVESSYSAHKERHSKQGALVSAGFKVSTTVRAEDTMMKEMPDDLSSITKQDLEAELDRYNTMRKSYSHEELSEWTDAERRIGELTLSEARSVGGTLPASTGRAASSTRLTHQEANTMAERDLGSTFLLPHVHLYKPDVTSDVSEFDSL